MKWLAALLIVCTGCTKEAPPQPEAAKKEETKKDEHKSASEPMLDQAAQRQAQIRVETVQRKSEPITITANGRLTLNENRRWHVGAITEGRVMRVLANVGDVVKDGQLLAGFHSHDIHESRADYRKAKAEVNRLTTALSFAQRQRDRARRLYELKAGSLEQMEHAESEYRSMQISVANAETELERTRIHLVEFLQVSPEPHEEHKEGEADHAEDLIPVRAPEAGTVIKRAISSGSVVSAGEEMFEIADLRTVWMIAAVNEEHLGKLRLGMSTRVTVAAYAGETFTGRITKLGDQLDPATRTMPVRIELANNAGKLKPEMYGTADIAGGGSAESMFIPSAAIQSVNGQNAVFVQLDDRRFAVRAVVTGRALENRTEILEGIKPGDRVVVGGSYVLKSQLLKGSLDEE